MTTEGKSNLFCGTGTSPVPTGLEVLCSWCLRVRGENGGWSSVELGDTRDRFGHYSHGICPDCLKRHFQELAIIVSATAADRAAQRAAAGREDLSSLSTAGQDANSPDRVR